MNTLSNRLSRIEAAMPAQKVERRVLRIVASANDEARAVELAKAEGWKPDSDDICVFRLISLNPGIENRQAGAPRVMSKNW
jgi:hypothetical protein